MTLSRDGREVRGVGSHKQKERLLGRYGSVYEAQSLVRQNICRVVSVGMASVGYRPIVVKVVVVILGQGECVPLIPARRDVGT